MLKKYIGPTLVVVFAALATAGTVPIEPFGESFEGLQIYPYWVATQRSGSVTLSKDRAYSGSQSLKFASVSGGDRTLSAEHSLPKLTKGNVSVAFYDSAPGQETLYEYLLLTDSTNPNHSVAVGTQDFDAYCYMAYVGSGSMGPNANCGIYPQMETTPIKRTPGWHLFSIHYDKSTVSIAIDGAMIFTAAVDYQFDAIQLVVAGPYWRPNTVAYFDNFSFTPLPLYGYW